MQIRDYLIKLNFKSGLYLGLKKGFCGKDGYIHNGDYWILRIDRKDDLYRFTNIVKPYLRHKDKVRDADRVIRNITSRNRKYGYIGMKVLNFDHVQKIPITDHNFALR